MINDLSPTLGARWRALLPGILLLGWVGCHPAQAATYIINSTADTPFSSGMCNGTSPCTLRAAVQLANSTANTADTLTLPAGAYKLDHTGPNENAASTGDLDITSPITINGTDKTTTIIDGNATDRVFHIQSGGNLTLQNLTVRNGKVTGALGGGIYNEDGIADLESVVVTANTAQTSSSAGGSGGGIYNNGTMTLDNCTVSNNTVNTSLSAGGGGGVYNFGILTVTNCTFDGNQVAAAGSGGATPGGGALQTEGVTGIGSSLNQSTNTGSTFTNNTAPLGGAIRNLFGRVILDTSVVDGNTADLEGGGVENVDGNVTISSSAIRNNSAAQNGGGVNNLGTMDIGNSAIYGNQSPGVNPGAGGAGGGVFNGGDGVLTIFSTTISQNSARLGGGLYNHREAGITNATIYNNSATSTTFTPNGSEVFACGNKDETLGTGCSTGIDDATGAQLIHSKFVNTIIGNDTTAANCGGDVTDLITSNGHNLETANTCGFAASGDQRSVSPAVLFNSGLAANGGKLAELLTYSLPTSSPAHNAADVSQCPLTDERNFTRIENTGDGCDIGAYEISSTSNFNVLDLALDIQFKNADPQNGSVQTTFTVTVLNKSSQNASNVVLTLKIPTLPWLNVTSLGAGDSNGSCTRTTDGVTCTLPSLAAFQSTDFFVATLATQAGAFTVDGDAESDAADNFRPDNLKSVTITIPTVSGSSTNGNNFGGTSGGGTVDALSLAVLLIPALRRVRPRR
jgi:hypothetical protein